MISKLHTRVLICKWIFNQLFWYLGFFPSGYLICYSISNPFHFNISTADFKLGLCSVKVKSYTARCRKIHFNDPNDRFNGLVWTMNCWTVLLLWLLSLVCFCFDFYATLVCHVAVALCNITIRTGEAFMDVMSITVCHSISL